MVLVGDLTASPANLAKADLLPLSDASSGYLTKVTVDQLIKPVAGSITGTGVTNNLGAVGSTWTKVTGFDAVSGLGQGTTESHSSDQITVNNPQICLVMYSVTMSNNTGARTLGARLANDGSALAGSYAHEQSGAADGKINVAGHALTSIAATDIITLEVTHSTGTSTGNLTVHECVLTVIPIGPAS